MPVKKDASGRRSVEAEVEVPGTPEEVWQAIATGPGISSWFVPSEVEGRDGGRAVSHFAPDGSMDSVGKITAWSPPNRFVVETNDEMPGGTGAVATEWTVEARAGGTCVVRVVHNWFASTDDWDNQMEGHTHGWVAFFRILRLYLASFRGQHGVSFQVMATAPEPAANAWKALLAPLGISGPIVGGRIGPAPGAPPLSGTVHSIGQPEFPELLVETDQPGPGIAHFFPLPMPGRSSSPGACISSAPTQPRLPPAHSRCGKNGSANGFRRSVGNAHAATLHGRPGYRAAVRVGSRTLADNNGLDERAGYCGGVQ